MNASEPIVVHKGLDNVYVDESSICLIDSDDSKLYYRGYDAEELVEKSTYEEVGYLLLYGSLPTSAELNSFTKTLRDNYSIPAEVVETLRRFPRDAHPMDVLRTGVSMCASFDERENTLEANKRKAVRIVARIPALIAAHSRIRHGLDPVAPDMSLPIASNFLYMLRGEMPEEFEARVMDKVMILHAEHEMNASTFSCIVTASTMSDIYSVITSGICTLRGPLHGGANEAALSYILGVGSPEKAEGAVDNTLRSGGRIMGFGHRIYKNWDPRYRVLKPIARQLCDQKGKSLVYLTAEAIETAALKRLVDHKIFPNVDFYSGVVLNALGIETDLFTPVFAMSRSVGWVAHAIEYLENNRLIRPKTRYTGEIGRKYTPLSERTALASA